MGKYKFNTLFQFLTKSKIKAGEGKSEGKYPFYTSSQEVNKYIDKMQHNTEALVFGTGGMASIHYVDSAFSTSTDCFVVTQKKDDFFTKYIYYFFIANFHILQNGFKGAGLKHISKKYIEDIEIPVIDKNEQKNIIKKLDKAQELIDLRKESIAKLDELAKSIFINMFGDPVSNLKGWEVRELDDVCEITSSKRVYKSDYVSEGIPFYKIKEIILKSKNIEPKEIEYISIDAFENFASKFGYPHEGDILVTAVGATIGYFYLVDDEKFYFKDGNLIWLRNYKMDINKKFLLYMFRTKEFKNKILELSKGAAQNALTIVKLKSVFICTPPIDLQNKFTSIIEKIEEQKSLYEKELEKLEENFQALLQQSFKE